MLIVTTETIPGYALEPLGLVEGSCIQTVHAGKDIAASFKTLIGGELTSYNEMMETSRKTALQRMTANAEALHADAVVAARISTSSIMQSAAEVMIYGTAVKLTKL